MCCLHFPCWVSSTYWQQHCTHSVVCSMSCWAHLLTSYAGPSSSSRISLLLLLHLLLLHLLLPLPVL
jgi:hypothetical protein